MEGMKNKMRKSFRWCIIISLIGVLLLNISILMIHITGLLKLSQMLILLLISVIVDVVNNLFSIFDVQHILISGILKWCKIVFQIGTILLLVSNFILWYSKVPDSFSDRVLDRVSDVATYCINNIVL